MRNTHILAGIVSAVILAASGIAHAGSCEGINARKYEKPIAVHKSSDKSVTYLLQSTGVTSRKVASGQTQDASYQTCSGLWTVNADKSGFGAGSCYTVDPDGDYRITSWEGKKAAGKSATSGGTWALVIVRPPWNGLAAAASAAGSWRSAASAPPRR